jgi:hypothetical protein
LEARAQTSEGRMMTNGFCPEHLYMTPEFDRALALNGAMIALVLEREGLGKIAWNEITLLREASLAELVQSQRLVEIYDDRPQQTSTRTVHMKCDDRLIAAVYAFLNFALPPAMHPYEDDYLILKLADRGGFTSFLACGIRETKPASEDDETEAA